MQYSLSEARNQLLKLAQAELSGEEALCRLSNSGSDWGYYRDNIEEEFTSKRISANAPASKNPLDDLFGKS